MENIKAEIKAYLLEEFCDETQTGPIEDETPLLSSGIIDSISALQLVEFLEGKYKFEFQAHEVDQENLNTLSRMENFVKSKINQ